jgi:hypothetical protein
MASNVNEFRGYIIALVVFVTLTFVLSGTTYWFYKKYTESQQVVDVKQKEASDANTKRLEAEKLREALVKDVLGFPEEMTNADIEKQKAAAVDERFGEHMKPHTYVRAVEWLTESIVKKHGEMGVLQSAADKFAAEKAQAIAAKDKELADVKKAKEEAEKRATDLAAEHEKYKTLSDSDKNKLITEKQLAAAQAQRLQLVTEEIAKGERYLSAERRKNWPRDAAPADPAKVVPGESANERRVMLLLDEMRDRERSIARQNQIITQLRVADPALQNTVLAATPKDDRVDAFDGRILSVNELDRTVLVSFATTTGIRTGLLFDVYSPTDPQPQLGSKKAVVEVSAIEGGSLVRCRVRRSSTADPILPGDAVASSLWSADAPLEVVIVGSPSLGGTPQADLERLRRLVERVGGTVAESVSPSTTIVVDGGFPKSRGASDGSRKPMTEKDKENRTKQLELAKQMGIKVQAVEPFLGMLGLQLDALGENRMQVPDGRLMPGVRVGP